MGLKMRLLAFLYDVFHVDILLEFNEYRLKCHKDRKNRARADVGENVTLGDVFLDKNVSIGSNTYINSGQIHTGRHSRVVIGRYCAIGYNVSIKARTHDLDQPTQNEAGPHLSREADIVIGDYVYIGDKVFIREGVTIGSNAVIGANSVVTRDVEAHSVVAGCPARVIKTLPR